MNKATITLEIEGASKEQLVRFQEIIQTLFEQGIFYARNGSITLHFDHEGTLQEIEKNLRSWRRSKPDRPLQKLYESATISLLDTKN